VTTSGKKRRSSDPGSVSRGGQKEGFQGGATPGLEGGGGTGHDHRGGEERRTAC